MPSLLEKLLDYQDQGLHSDTVSVELVEYCHQHIQYAKQFNEELNVALGQGLIDKTLFSSLHNVLFPHHQDETVFSLPESTLETTLSDVTEISAHNEKVKDTTVVAAEKTVVKTAVVKTDVVKTTGAADTPTEVAPQDFPQDEKTRLSTLRNDHHTKPALSSTDLDHSTAITERRKPRASDVTDRTVFNPRDKKLVNATLTKGSLIKNRFVLVEDIGQGGMGTVFKARDLRKEEMHDDSPYVAIKFLNDDLRDRQDALIALQREAVKSQALAHPNIVTVYDFDRDGDLVYLSMEFLDGQTLTNVIDNQYCRRLSSQKVMQMIELVARALAYSHQTGFAHADLKPSNIFLTAEGNIKVLDFGIAQAIRGANDHAPVEDSYFDVYSLGAITPNFASPQMLEDEVPTPADDMYSLGCVAYALLTGTHPFVDEMGNKVSGKEARKLGMVVNAIPDLPRRQMNAIRQCLYFERSERFQNAGEFLDAIKPPVKLRRWVVALLAALTITVLVSWWITLEQSTVALSLNDLPDEMAGLVETIKAADESFALGDVDQAHKLYSQVWEVSFEFDQLDQRDQYKLKVIIDKRIDNVTQFLIKEAEQPSLDEFRLVQLQLALEFLQQGGLGTLDKKIDDVLKELDEKIQRVNSSN